MTLTGGQLLRPVVDRLERALSASLGLRRVEMNSSTFMHGNGVLRLRGAYLRYHDAPMRGVAIPDELFHGKELDVVTCVTEFLRPIVERDLAEALAETLE